MRTRLLGSVLSCAVLCLGCGEDDSGSSWHYGSTDASQDASDASTTDAQVSDAGDAANDVGVDAPADAGGDVTGQDGSPEASAPVPALYPSDRTQSPQTQYVVDRMKDVLARNPGSHRDLFMKVGDSISVSTRFLHCFGDGDADLGAYGALQPTLDAYAAATIAGTTSFDRVSACVEGGKTAFWAMDGQPSPLETEMSALNPALAVVMFGTNDIGWFSPDHIHTLNWYHGYMFDLVDALLDAGIVPILSTLPPRDDKPSLDAWIPTFNAVIRGMAQGRQIPLVDFHRELQPLPSHGLSSDGVHPNAYTSAGDACTLTTEGLDYGYNVRNWITLTGLDRTRRAAIADEGPLDDDAPRLEGEGTIATPFVALGNPFVDVRDTNDAISDGLDTYGCSTADESGPEFVYRLSVTESVRLRAVVLDRGDVDIDIHLLGDTVSEASCLTRGDTIVEQDLSPGTYHLVLDTYVSGGQALGGEYLLAVMLCSPGDPACIQ
jgi:GDSL-like Lipase/Acylhydrolase family